MKKIKLPRGLWIALAAAAALAAGLAAFRAFSGSRIVGPLDMRPWRRPAAVRPVGVRVEPVSSRPSAAPMPAPAGQARLAVILDDWGMNEPLLDDAIALRRPITVSVLPHLPHSASIARRAAAAGLGVMLHMPMQPKSKAAARESEVIGVDMPEVRIRRYLDEALASVPGVRGVNNHQGSAATSDARVMRTVLGYLNEKHLFFVDSFVDSTTAGPAAAREIGIPFAKRDVFIDNVASLEPIKTQLRKAVQKALRAKTAIAIGHDKRVTLEAIRQMVPEIEKAGVKLVLAEELVKS